MDFKQILGDLFTILCQGTIAGLIVLAATNWLENKKEKDLRCKNALLVWLEIQGHLAEINDILTHNKFPINSGSSIEFSISTWNSVKIYLTSLPVNELQSIGAYYQSLPAIDHLVNSYAGRPLIPVMVASLTQVQAMGVMTQHLLASYWDLKNAEKHRQCFSHTREQSRNLL
ncbi:hypothetical protein SPSIL_008640 [Sporomusa silvacetica DSM 10669]|uniref:Uncharacterized protein n=1 Tax=Sporomusa silvacetica DSM 10669 TaxID=1123289 RepID=A0ABZ3IGK3_9FIRM|nr:hypothetical protein [Sporomusa silvacetica]OZC13176.1 hypothetical protein SPSIL_56320 [Sporomusa silvacetica DSM 10669]